jgi:peptide/nickel transport system permease protein
MWRYIVMRVLAALPVVAVVGVITFSLVHIAPGDPASIILGNDATPENLRELREYMGLDKPLPIQFAKYVGKLAQGDLGTSAFSKRTIWFEAKGRIQPTASLAIQTIILSSFLGISLGVISAWQAGRPLDQILRLVSVLGFSVPGFYLAFLLIWGFSVNLGWFGVTGYTRIQDGFFEHFHSLALAVIVNGVLGATFISRLTRSAMLEVLREDYVRTARAKGVAEPGVYLRHAFRNASIPVVTVIGATIPALVTGFVVTESIFAIPGLSKMLLSAITNRDYAVVQGMLLVVATGFVFMNLVVDVIYAYIDPRIRY